MGKLGVRFSAQDIGDLKAQLRVSEIKVDLPTFAPLSTLP